MIYWIKMYFTDAKGHARALYEVLVLFAFSVLPFFITAMVRSAKNPDGSFASMTDLFSRGQAYLLAYALFGSIFWLAFLKPDKPRHGARAFLGLIAVLALLPVVGFLGIDPTFSTILNKSMITASYVIYASLLFIRYLLLFYMNIAPPAAAEIFDRESSDMRNRYKEFRQHG